MNDFVSIAITVTPPRDQSTVSLCVAQVDDKILDRESLVFLLIV